jgi:Phospholipase_D-nuclease N-terminal
VAKALWFLFIVFVPVIGVLSYLIVRPADPYVIVEV